VQRFIWWECHGGAGAAAKDDWGLFGFPTIGGAVRAKVCALVKVLGVLPDLDDHRQRNIIKAPIRSRSSSRLGCGLRIIAWDIYPRLERGKTRCRGPTRCDWLPDLIRHCTELGVFNRDKCKSAQLGATPEAALQADRTELRLLHRVKKGPGRAIYTGGGRNSV